MNKEEFKDFLILSIFVIFARSKLSSAVVFNLRNGPSLYYVRQHFFGFMSAWIVLNVNKNYQPPNPFADVV